MKRTGQSTLIADSDLRAADVRVVAGLTYRQLNDWDSKGAVPRKRRAAGEWRRFSARGVFALMVCSEIRTRFGVPVESLSFVRSSMLQKGADHLRAAAELMHAGLTAWLLTDLRETFILDTDHEFAAMFRGGLLQGEHPRAYVLLNLNPLVNRLLDALSNRARLQNRKSALAGRAHWTGRMAHPRIKKRAPKKP